MKQVSIENELREVVSRLITEVDLATNQGRLDVNLISEDSWIPILKEVYKCPNLINLNKGTKNFPGIDLGDDQDRVAFQVTASTDLEKVKSTLLQFNSRNYKSSYDELYIFTIRKKQKSYSQKAIDKAIDGAIQFDSKTHIIDPGDILSEITSFRLPAQERMLQEFKSILGDIESSISLLNSPEYAPHLLISNLTKITCPEVIYVADLHYDKNSIISAARDDLGYKNSKTPGKYLQVKFGLLLADNYYEGWALHENKIFTFYDIESTSIFDSVIDRGTIEAITTEEISQHELVEYQNLFKYLLKACLSDQLKPLNIEWNKKHKQFYFLPIDDGDNHRKVNWVGKKKSSRTVFIRKNQQKDPEKVAFYKHLSFYVSFLFCESDWYAAITPSWFFTWNKFKKNKFHDDLLTKQKKLEHNHTVRDQVRFLGYMLKHEISDDSLIGFGDLEEFEYLSSQPNQSEENTSSTEEVENAD